MSKAVRVPFPFFAPPLLSLLLVSLAFGAAGGAQPPARAEEPAQPPAQAKDPNRAAPEPVVVARIGDCVITRPELEERLVREIQPQRGDDDLVESGPVTAEGVLNKMLAEKALSLEGRRLGYLNDELIHSGVEQFEQQRLRQMLVQNYLKENPPAVQEEEVARQMKANPKLTRAQAVAQVQRAAAIQLLDKFYSQLVAKFQLKKVTENFAEAARIHDRLLNRPAQPRGPGESWIKNSQVRDELSEKEKQLVLATYEGGQFTLKDWFDVICSIAPPRRPTDLGTPAGVEKLVDRALPASILVAEAKARGCDKDRQLRSDVRQLEDRRLLYKMQDEKGRGAPEPNAAEIRAFFEKHQEQFAVKATVKIDQIWCADLATARKVKDLLAQEPDFAALKKAHSLEKSTEPHNVSADSEGLFWPELWKAEPNQVVGPLRGFYRDGLRWRLVKVLEKKPAQVQPYAPALENRVKWAIIGASRRSRLESYEKELLARYPHEIFRERMAGLDPLELAMKKPR
jgi:hypothetical protein